SEAVPVEQLVEHCVRDVQREVELAVAVLEVVPLEQSAIEVGKTSESPGRSGALCRPPVQCPVKQRYEDGAVEAPTRSQTRVPPGMPAERVRSLGERLLPREQVQEHQTTQEEERDPLPLPPPAGRNTGPFRCDPRTHGSERLEKAVRNAASIEGTKVSQ